MAGSGAKYRLDGSDQGGSPASSASEGSKDEDVEQMIEKWTGRPPPEREDRW